MNPTLTTLLEIQDLRSKLHELEESPEMEAQEFNIDVGVATEQLRTKIDALIGDLDERVRRRYRRVASSVDRAVVPVINGVCYGCFVSIPSAVARDQDPNLNLQTCETCGRFLYVLQ